MDMTFSYKPVLLLAMLECADERGRVSVDNLVRQFISYYEQRRLANLMVEKESSIFSNPDVRASDAKRNILVNPFKRFADMRFMMYSKDL